MFLDAEQTFCDLYSCMCLQILIVWIVGRSSLVVDILVDCCRCCVVVAVDVVGRSSRQQRCVLVSHVPALSCFG